MSESNNSACDDCVFAPECNSAKLGTENGCDEFLSNSEPDFITKSKAKKNKGAKNRDFFQIARFNTFYQTSRLILWPGLGMLLMQMAGAYLNGEYLYSGLYCVCVVFCILCLRLNPYECDHAHLDVGESYIICVQCKMVWTLPIIDENNVKLTKEG